MKWLNGNSSHFLKCSKENYHPKKPLLLRKLKKPLISRYVLETNCKTHSKNLKLEFTLMMLHSARIWTITLFLSRVCVETRVFLH